MSNLNNRVNKLEQDGGPPDRKIVVVVYGEDGRAVHGSGEEIIGMTREEITAHYNTENLVFLNVVYIPDNGRRDNQ